MVIWVGEGRGSKRPVRASAAHRTIRWVHAQRAAQYQAFAGLHAASNGRMCASDLLPPEGKGRATRNPRHGTEFDDQWDDQVQVGKPLPISTSTLVTDGGYAALEVEPARREGHFAALLGAR